MEERRRIALGRCILAAVRGRESALNTLVRISKQLNEDNREEKGYARDAAAFKICLMTGEGEEG